MCDTLVSITDDGVLFAKNSDRDRTSPRSSNGIPLRTIRPAQSSPAHGSRSLSTATPEPCCCHDRGGCGGAEMGANEAGVVIGNEAVFTRGRSEADPGLLGMDLLRLALERADSAHEAVGCIVELLETYGQGGSCSYEHPGFTYDNSFIVADPNGAVVLETAGRSHATEQVGAPGRSISNGLTIEGFARAHADRLRGRVAQCDIRRAHRGRRPFRKHRR
ncbi:MAG: hypothetical protein M5U19_22040 [Microthrixaceae bacterium]|nr:hypothetical protein [Microthrixaceae bacterium]